MNRHKLLALAAMLLVPLAACDEGTPPVPEGTIDGQVSIEGQGHDGVTVTLNTGTSTTTSGGGRFSFANVQGGTYTLTITGYPADASFASTSQPATITSAGQTATVNFTGTYIRTASILGSVTVERAGVSGVTVRLSGMSDASTQTDANGQFAFTQLRAGSYELELSGFAADVSFSAPAQNVTLAVGETETTTFEGTYVRTAGIQGRVAVEGQGLVGVTVNLSGVGPARTATTDAAGQYAFAELRAGVYQVGISGFSADDYEFGETSKSVTVALGQTANVPFDGTRLRTAGISGQVAVAGQGIGGVMVALSGAATASDTTSVQGIYGFTGLAAGTYTVTISGWDDALYTFDMTTKTVELADDQAAETNFAGNHVANATVMGYAFYDANPQNGTLDEGDEDMYALAGLSVTLTGPGVDQRRAAMTNANGMYMFEGLVAGPYQVSVSAGALDSANVDSRVEYGLPGASSSISVRPGATVTQNLPFNIITQTITMQAMMGNGKTGKDAKTGDMIGGVGIDFYPTYQAAEAERGQLSEKMAMTDTITGTATVMFPRSADTGPGGRDNVVFAKVAALPHDDLEVTANEILEVSYDPRKLESAAAQAVQVINRRAVFQYWVKNVETDLGGDKFLEGWKSEVRTNVEHSGALALQPTSNKNGRATFTDLLAPDDLPQTFYVKLAGTQAQAMGEAFMGTPEPDTSVAMLEKTPTAGSFLAYTYDGIVMPGDTADLGVLRVKWTTQTLIVGVHYEATHIPGFDANIAGGDSRPAAGSADQIKIKLQTRDKHGTPQDWKYPRLSKPTGGTTMPRSPKGRGTTDAGLVVFGDLPADVNFIVAADAQGARKIYGDDDLDTFIGAREKESRGSHSSGAFGTQSGTGPIVYICPLAAEAGRAACSTFAYGYTDGIVYGTVTNSQNATAFDDDTLTIKITPLFTLGSTESKTAEVLDGVGTYRIEGLEGGKHVISFESSATWSGAIMGSTTGATTDTVTVLANSDGGGNDSLATANFRATYLKTMIEGTVANNYGDSLSNNRGTTTAVRSQTVSGAKMTLMRVAGTKRTTVSTATTNSVGKFKFVDVPEGNYVVEGTDTDDYLLKASNTKTPNRSGVVTTTVASRMVTSGSMLPRWSYGQVPGAGVPVSSDSALRVLDTEADVDFVVLFKNGAIDGTAMERRVGASVDSAMVGARVRLLKCGWASNLAGVINSDFQLFECPGGRYDTSYTTKVDTTDSSGSFSFDKLQEGIYVVEIDMTGIPYDTANSTPALGTWLIGNDAGQTVNVRVILSS